MRELLLLFVIWVPGICFYFLIFFLGVSFLLKGFYTSNSALLVLMHLVRCDLVENSCKFSVNSYHVYVKLK
jgi:hypothetical protein